MWGSRFFFPALIATASAGSSCYTSHKRVSLDVFFSLGYDYGKGVTLYG